MEKQTKNFAGKIASELDLDKDKQEVIAYGVFALFHMVLSIVLVIIFGVLFNVAVEALIVSFTVSILRKYSGGVHASSPGICAAVGTILSVGQALLISRVISPVVSLDLTIIMGILVFAWSYYIIIKLSPVDSPAKPIKKEEKRKRMRKGSIIILSAYLVIAVSIIIMFNITHEQRLITFALCVLGGTCWQAFTLTRGGHIVVNLIDNFSNHILKSTRRVN